MEPFIKLSGIVAPLDKTNVDTDQIIPKQFLKRIERTGFGEFLFFDWRYLDDGSINPEFELNKKRYSNASVLLARDNFGSGSSREHAPWALKEYGFRSIIAPSFADIFHNNCFKNSILPITFSAKIIGDLFTLIDMNEGYTVNIDLENQTVSDDLGNSWNFNIDAFKKEVLLKGLDDISQTLQLEKFINNYETNLKEDRNWVLPRNPN